MKRNTSSSTSAATAMLRASCDRCRGQKLRCIPISDNPTGPCQRCVRAQVSETCVYAPRTRTGRAQRSGGEATPSFSRRDIDGSGSTLPGMSHFTIDLSPKASSSWADHATAPYGSQTPARKQSDKATPQSVSMDGPSQAIMAPIDGSWNFDLASLDTDSSYFDTSLPDASDWLLSAPGTASSMDSSLPSAHRGDSFNVANSLYGQAGGDFTNVPNLLPLQHTNSGSEMNVDASTSVTDRPGPLVDMSALLAEMSPYETQLRKLTGSDLQEYPIGDALFLAQRFHDILNAYNYINSDEMASDLSVLPNGLTYPCYKTMIQIYDAVFTFLHRHLSRTMDPSSMAHDHKHPPQPAGAADMHSYRGLRLSQLQPVCLCASWDPVRKAVSMLVSALGGAEAALSLATDLRVVTAARLPPSGRPNSRARRGIFEEDMSYSLNDGRLYSHVREQARKLRKRVDEVQELLEFNSVGSDRGV